MRPISILVVCMATAAYLAAAPAPASTASIVGQWEITKSSGDAPEGTLVEFTAAGEVKVVVKIDNQELKIEGKYTLANDKLTLQLKANDKEVKEELSVKKLENDELQLEDKDKRLDVLKKKK